MHRKQHSKNKEIQHLRLKKSFEKQIRHEIRKTLLYADIFEYPLTGNQLFTFLGVKLSASEFLSALPSIAHTRIGKTFYYFLPRRKRLVEKRLHREKESNKKIKYAKHVVKILRFIPTIHFIGISGSVALFNADKKADTDLFFITNKGTVWVTRFLVYVTLLLLGILRRNGKSIANTICANMFLDIDTLRFPSEKRNIYLAHEILQVMPLFNKNHAYEKLLSKNKWIKDFFPNVVIPRIKKEEGNQINFLFSFLEDMMRMIQLHYMKKKKTREITTSTIIAFHPINYEAIILKAYEKKRKKYAV